MLWAGEKTKSRIILDERVHPSERASQSHTGVSFSRTMKRHPSLVPLSHDHHLGLLLARRIQEGSAAPQSTWPEERDLQRDRTVAFFDVFWGFHMEAEERFLFPLAETHFTPPNGLLSLLRKQHQQLRSLVEQLREAHGVQLENLLLRFAHVLELHIRKEERVFFQRLQREVLEKELLQCGNQMESYFTASPKAGSEQCLTFL